MSKLRLATGGVVLLMLTVAVSGISPVATAKQRGRKDPPSPRVEYTVASATAAAETTSVIAPSLAGPPHRNGFGPVPERLSLVLVGGLLLGLAAAVRRTT